MTTTILETSLSAFWVDSDSFCCMATCGWKIKNVRSNLLFSHLWTENYKNQIKVAYSTDGHPHSKVAQDDDSQGEDTASKHENNHVGLYSRVFTSTEHIRSTGSLQSMRPVPKARKCLVSSLYLKDSAFVCICDIKRSSRVVYLLHPNMGGAHQTADQTQEKTIPAVAHLASNLTFPKGLHTTIHLSQEMIVRDQRAAIPV